MPLKKTPGTNNFREVQRFNQWWVLAIVAGIAFAGWWAFIEQIVLGRPWGNNPAPDGIVVLMWLVFGIGVPAMMRWVRLIVEVTDDALDIRYVPFRHRVIPLSTISSAQPRTYRPLLEYFGWGIRWMPGRGWVYSVSGDQGVQLVLGRRRKLLLGSRKPLELAAAIAAAHTPYPDGPTERQSFHDNDQYDDLNIPAEDEPMFETCRENAHCQAAQQVGRISEPTMTRIQRDNPKDRRANVMAALKRTRLRDRLLSVRAAFFPALGSAVAWIQERARRLGASQRVQRFADDPKQHAAHAVHSAAQAGRQVGANAARAGERVKDKVTHSLSAARLPSRVAVPAMRYVRDPQLIVEDLKKTG